MKTVSASAGSKLILFGEHLILDGGTGYAIPYLETAVTVTMASGNDQILGGQNWSERQQTTLQMDLKQVRYELGIREPVNVTISLHEQLRLGSGMGGSASWSVALLRAAVEYTQYPLDSQRAYDILQELENRHHGGTASGLDHTTIVMDSPVMTDGKVLAVWDVTLHRGFWRTCHVYHTGTPAESTAEMIRIVQERKKSTPPPAQLLIETERLAEQDARELPELINIAGEYQGKIGIASLSVTNAMRELRQLGGSAKVSGAGGMSAGSGVLIAYHEDESVLDNWATEHQYERLPDITYTNSR